MNSKTWETGAGGEKGSGLLRVTQRGTDRLQLSAALVRVHGKSWPAWSAGYRQISACRDIALASLEQAMIAFTDAAKLAADLVAGGEIDLQTVVDRLHNAAVAYGLTNLYRIDEIQKILSETFHATQI